MNEEENKVEINLSNILKVKPLNIYKYLKRRPRDVISEGELLAEKKTLVSHLTVKSPISGKITEVDLKKGTVRIVKNGGQSGKVTIPVAGKVKSIGQDKIEIEVKGIRIKGLTGSGENRLARLKVLADEKRSYFDIGSEVEKQLILIKKAGSEILAKLDTLEALGVISTELAENNDFSVLVVSDDSFSELERAENKLVWLRPIPKNRYFPQIL